MSKQFKPFHEQLADKLVAELKAGTSPFQKPVKENGMPAFVTPVNPVTMKGYSAMNAIALSMKGHDDPRWMSADTARFAGYWVKEGAKGTLINFPKKNDIQAVRTVDGQKIKGEDGKTQTKTVEFDKPQNTKAFLFNATQIKEFPPLEDFLVKQQEVQPLSPIERAEKLIADSGAVIIYGGQEAFYDKEKDEIHLPPTQSFGSETRYYQAAIHQLAHWTGHETRLKRPMEGKLGSMDYGREEFRAAIAAMLIGGELKIGHNFGQHAAYTNNWAKMLKEDPFELTKASGDAQKIATMLLGTGQKREQKQDAAINDEKPPVSNTLAKGEEIAYKDTTYKVLDQKGKTLHMEKTGTGEKFKLKPTDQLYSKLVEARNNPPERELEVAEEQGEQQNQKIGR